MLSRRFTVTSFLATAAVVLGTLSVPQAASAQRRDRQDAEGAESDSSKGDPLSRAVGGLQLRSIGPAVVSGRISDLAIHPTDLSTWYVATASGGVWKTSNAGTT